MDNVDTLPVLGYLLHTFKKNPISIIDDVVFVCTQHLLNTSVHLFETLINLGANPNNIFLIGKHYSTCAPTVEKLTKLGIQIQPLTQLVKLGEYKKIFDKELQRLWDSVRLHMQKNSPKAVVILDDGGRCLDFIHGGILENVPAVGIEQTSAGLFNPKILDLPIPFIDVATCAAKSMLESDIIAYELLMAITDVLPKNTEKYRCGVVGIGTIGAAVAKKLSALGYGVILYDKEQDNISQISSTVKTVNSLKDLLQNVDYVIGCTGRDITKDIDIESDIIADKVFISCSSEDKEFLSLLRYIQKNSTPNKHNSPLDSIKHKLNNGASVHILNGGFPINFNRTHEISPPHMIQLTRGLLLGAIIQAVAMIADNNQQLYRGRTSLNYLLQKHVVSYWNKSNEFNLTSIELVKKFNDCDWVANHSKGRTLDIDYFSSCFDDDSSIFDIFDITETTIA